MARPTPPHGPPHGPLHGRRADVVRRWSAAAVLALVACRGDAPDAAQDASALGTVGAHEHGAARVDVAVDDTVVTVELIAPGMSLYGFEGEAATAEQRATRERALARLREGFASMFELAAESGCAMGAPTIETGDAGDHAAHHDAHADDHDTARADDGHDEVHAVARAVCRRTPAGTRLRLAIGQLFPDVEHVDLQVVSESVQFGGRVRATGYVAQL